MVRPPQVFALYGELGAGKTCLAQGLSQGVGIKQRLISPTYSLIREYSGRYPLVHVDCYRLKGEEEAVDIGLREILDRSTIMLVEWPEKIERLLPDSCLKIHITIIDEVTRLISIATKTPG